MATPKKKAGKLVPKKAAPKKLKPAPKKSIVKKLVKKLHTKKLVAKKPAPPRKVVKKLPVKPAAKPAVKFTPAPAPKKRPRIDPSLDYRNLRKYTHLKLTEILSAHSEGDNWTANEFVEHLKTLETEVPAWKARKLPLPNGQKRKRGRPSKAEIEARNAAVKPLNSKAAADAAMAKAKAFAAGPTLPAPKLAPKLALPPKLVPKLVLKPAVSQAN